MTGLPPFTITNPFLVARARPQIQFVKEPPMTTTGKIMRGEVRKLEIEKKARKNRMGRR
jgi:acyl-coenzyme A synthetase/AMP-(fatty) acid ligase